ncbi:hypothetical protein LTR86_009625 [Recurvomyces mirabilis]|nr:hypothetical protein LTR86_009625 [Recurvomyces mirabilis]
MATDFSTQDKKKNRISNLFGSKKSYEGIGGRPDVVSPTGQSADSAYASSDPSTHRPSPDSKYVKTVPIENTGKISGVSRDRHLGLNESTGEVLDTDTGEVVTTVTTTTTTTTTTVHKGKGTDKKETMVQVETRPGEHNTSAQIAEAPGDGPSNRLHPSATEPPRRTTPAPIETQQPHHQSIDVGSPTSPMRNPNRNSGPYGEPPSPYGKHNFSYPSRSDLKGTAATGEENGYQHHDYSAQPQNNYPQSRPSQPSAIESLKAAAIGLHGVGETLRSTLNNEVDSRFPRSNTEKASYANAKNRAEMERGQREMARLREVNGLRPTVSQQSPPIQQNQIGAGAIPVQRPTDALPPPQQNADAPRLHAPGTWGSGRVNDVRKPGPNISVSPVNPDVVHPAHRPQQQGESLGGAPQLPPLEHTVTPGDRYPSMDGRRPEPNGQQRFGGERPPVPVEPDRNPMQNVQAVSHVQGHPGMEQEEEKKGGFRKLFRRKEVPG